MSGACRRKEKELELELLFDSNFHSRLERCVNDAPFVVLVNTTAAARH